MGSVYFEKVRIYFVYILIIFSLFLVSFQLTLSSSVTYSLYYGQFYDVVPEPYVLSLSQEVALNNADDYVNYISGEDDEISLKVSYEERIHMNDVRYLYSDLQKSALMFVLSFLWILFFTCRNMFSRKFWFWNNTQIAFRIHIVFYVTIVTATLFFSQIFIFLHKLFFTNDFWLLPYNSVTIQTFPQSFFVFFFLCVILLTSLLYWLLVQVVPKLRQQGEET